MSLLNVVDVPLKTRHPESSWEDGHSRCPYCLEIFTSEMLAKQQARICPLCQHPILPTLLGTSVHLFNRRQQWDYLLNEMKFIWDWEYAWFSGIRKKEQGSLFEFHYEKADFDDLCDALFMLVKGWERFVKGFEDMEVLVLESLQDQGQEYGLMARDLKRGKPWRERARELSAASAGPRLIVEFQLDYVKNLPWGVFCGSERENILFYLEGRLDQLGDT